MFDLHGLGGNKKTTQIGYNLEKNNLLDKFCLDVEFEDIEAIIGGNLMIFLINF
jgi:hypothetical protein